MSGLCRFSYLQDQGLLEAAEEPAIRRQRANRTNTGDAKKGANLFKVSRTVSQYAYRR